MFLVSTCALWQTRDSVEYLWVDTHTYRAITLSILYIVTLYTLNLLMGKIHQQKLVRQNFCDLSYTISDLIQYFCKWAYVLCICSMYNQHCIIVQPGYHSSVIWCNQITPAGPQRLLSHSATNYHFVHRLLLVIMYKWFFQRGLYFTKIAQLNIFGS